VEPAETTAAVTCTSLTWHNNKRTKENNPCESRYSQKRKISEIYANAINPHIANLPSRRTSKAAQHPCVLNRFPFSQKLSKRSLPLVAQFFPSYFLFLPTQRGASCLPLPVGQTAEAPLISPHHGKTTRKTKHKTSVRVSDFIIYTTRLFAGLQTRGSW